MPRPGNRFEACQPLPNIHLRYAFFVSVYFKRGGQTPTLDAGFLNPGQFDQHKENRCRACGGRDDRHRGQP